MFPLNGNPDVPHCQGIDGVIEAYHYTLETAQLCEPSYAAPIINHVAKLAEQAAERSDIQVIKIVAHVRESNSVLPPKFCTSLHHEK